MPLIHLFNPENDLALAHGKSNYTAPPNAVALHNAGEALPLWYADDNDFVIAPNIDYKWLEYIYSNTNIQAKIFSPDRNHIELTARPWGWSLDALRQLQSQGVNSNSLISISKIEKIRELSHRRTTISILSQLKEHLNFNIHTLPLEAKSYNEVISFAKANNGCYLKSPWSSSGRGVVNASTLSEEELSRRAEGIIKRQGSILCEIPLNKVIDFAMLFYSDGHKVNKIGYSYFHNTHNTAYTGNTITSDKNIEEFLSSYIPQEHLHNISSSLEKIFSNDIAPFYSGFFGVDMLIYRDAQNNFNIAPCIEINLRMTMGVVAWHLFQKHIHPDSNAILRVEYGNPTASTAQPIFENKRLVVGTLNLVPHNANFHFTIEANKNSKSFKLGV